MKTKNILSKVAAVSAAFFIAGLAQANATNTNVFTSTNVAENISFAMTFYEQGTTNHVNKVRVTSKDIIHAVGSLTSNTFSSHAQLIFLTELTSSNSVPAIVVKDGTNIVDASGLFFVTNSQLSITQSNGNARTTYSILQVIFNGGDTNVTPAGLSFNVNGFNTIKHSSPTINGHAFGLNQLTADVSGVGQDANGIPAVIHGSIDIFGHTTIRE